MNRFLLIRMCVLMLAAIVAPNVLTAQPYDCTAHSSWLTLGNGPSSPPIHSTTANGELYVCHYGSHRWGEPDSLFEMSAWNGAYWAKLSQFSIRTNRSTIAAMVTYRDVVTLVGRFTDFNRTGRDPMIVQWNGTGWTEMTMYPDDAYRITKAAVVGDRLYCTYSADSPRPKQKLAVWDGANWTEIPLGTFASIAQIVSDNGSLFALGNTIGQNTEYGQPDVVGRWDGSQWQMLGGSYFPGIINIAVAEGNLYAMMRPAGLPRGNGEGDWVQVHRWDGTAWQLIPVPYGYALYWTDVARKNDTLYVYGSLLDSVAAPPYRAHKFLARFDGANWQLLSTLNNPIEMLVPFADDMIAFGSFTGSCGHTARFAARLCDEGNCGTIAGTLSQDTDGDATNGPNGGPLQGRIVTITPGPFYATTDSAGGYQAIVPVGTYSAQPAPYLYWQQTFPLNAAPRTMALPSPGTISSGNDFYLAPIPNKNDLRASLTWDRVRPGRNTMLTLQVKNVGTTTISSGTIRLTLDGMLAYVGASIPPTQTNGNQVEWAITAFAPGSHVNIVVTLAAPFTLGLNTEVCADLAAIIASDETPADNQVHECERVRTSFDPNMIAVRPAGSEPHGLLRPQDSVLTYTVYFQNTGNDTAFTVMVIDTLAPWLDPSTLRAGPSSHPYMMEIGVGGELIWRFNHINLPDSTTNELSSHGMVTYTVGLRPGLAPGTIIDNKASIYFDYNAPVQTNSVRVVTPSSSTVNQPENIGEISVAPIPAHDRLTISGALPLGCSLRLCTVLGTVVRTVGGDDNESRTMELDGIPPGYYLLAVTSRNGSQHTVPVVIAR